MSMELTEKQLEWLDSQPDLPDADKSENRCALIWIGDSHAYGLADKNSDVDVRDATMPTMRQFLSLHRFAVRVPRLQAWGGITTYFRHITRNVVLWES